MRRHVKKGKRKCAFCFGIENHLMSVHTHTDTHTQAHKAGLIRPF